MAAFRIDSIGELARQMGFTPSQVRLSQIESAEELLHELDAAKAYPLDFVIFRITGYRPKRFQEGLLAGIALQHDLGLLIERASESLNMPADESVISIQMLANKFRITSKTIQRWRRRGLAARRFAFADGKMRVGFLASSIDKFLARHPETVANWAQSASSKINCDASESGRLTRLLMKKVRFFDDPLYHQDDAQAALDAIADRRDLIGAVQPSVFSRAEERIPRDLPEYCQELYRVPLLTAAEERGMFLKLNYHKFRFVSLRRKIDPQNASAIEVEELERQWKQVIETRNAIVRANLRLVVGVARKHLRPGLNLMELVSEGNLVLIRAVNGFDVHRNTRFSTYATLALMKGFARTVPMMVVAMHRTTSGSEALPAVSDGRIDQVERQRLERDDVEHLLSCLDEREREVLRRRFGLDRRRPEATLRSLSGDMGLSTGRLGQIQKNALAKLRAILRK